MLRPHTPKIFFLHIPKTGGTSVRRFLEDRYSLDDLPPPWVAHMKDEYGKGIDHRFINFARTKLLISDHFEYSIYEQFFSDYTLIVFFRDPRERLISLYHDLSTKSPENIASAGDQMKEFIQVAQKCSLKDFLEQDNELIQRHFSNAMVKRLGESDDLELALSRCLHRLDQKNVHIGITECMQESLVYLSNVFGWENPECSYELNVSSKRPMYTDLDEATKSLVDEMTLHDRRLYAEAMHRFKSQKKRIRMPKIFSSRQFAGKSFSMSDPLFGEGWHEREGIGTDKTWRWTGPSHESTLRFHLEKGKYQLYIFIISVFELNDVNGIQLKINGKILDHEYYGIIDGEHCVSVDSVCLDTPRTELLIRCPELRSHAQTDDVFQDTRMKGIAVTRVLFAPIDDDHLNREQLVAPL